MKPKFYVRRSWGRADWWMICQSSNNILIGEFPERGHAELVLNYLNSLTWREIGGKVKSVGGPYTHIKRRNKGSQS